MLYHKINFLIIFNKICSIVHEGSSTSIINCPIKDQIVDIDEVTQEALITDAERDCIIKIYSEKRKNSNGEEDDSNIDGDSVENDSSDENEKDPSKLVCPTTWDSVMCWPETHVNQTVYLSCPNYIDKFNIKSKTFNFCLLYEISDLEFNMINR